MSLELHAFLRNAIPTHEQWQAAIDALGYQVQIDNADYKTHTGFLPCKLKGVDSSFELCTDKASEIVEAYRDIQDRVTGRSAVLTFRWSGDLRECACVMAAAAALVKLCDASVYYPSDDIWYDVDALRADYEACLTDA